MPAISVKDLYTATVLPGYPAGSKAESISTVTPGNTITCRGEGKMTCVFETSWKAVQKEYRDIDTLDFPPSFKLEKKRIVHASVPGTGGVRSVPMCGIIVPPGGKRVLACTVIDRS